MKHTKNLICIALAIFSIGIFGAWTSVNGMPDEDRYANAQLHSLYVLETIDFDTKDSNAYMNSAPHYTALSGMANACGAVAGSEIVAYYDKYYPNMIPNWESFYASSGKYRIQDQVYIPALMNELYVLMRTNVDDGGVSESEFVSGLTQYINGKGYGVSMQNVLSGTSVNYETCKTAFENNKVIVLFSRATNLYNIGEGTTQDNISSSALSSSHIMMAYGYKEIKYYKNGILFRHDSYLMVSTGLQGTGVAYYKVNNHSLNSAYIVNII